MKKTTALAKIGSSAIVNWEEELAKEAAEVAEKEATPSGKFVSVRGGVLTVAGTPVKDNKADVVVLDAIYENKYYVGKFEPGSPKPPVCYAFARDEADMSPHDKCGEAQAEKCAGCKWNEFGTSDSGKGKACKNTRRLALIAASALESAEGVRDAEVFFLELPVTSVRGWSMYVKGLNATMKRPPYAVVTNLAVVPDTASQYRVVFSDPRPVDASIGGALRAKRAEVMDAIAFPYPETKPEEAGAKKGPIKSRKF